MLIPQDIDYEKIKGLLSESRQKLSIKLPKTLGQASRISGITPADISILALYIIKKDKLKQIVSRETTPSFQNRKTI
jgi:tRNA uridine 5-carboxymethylaminomethyl modification enzyme